jgi:hypothetical protein
MQAGDKNPITLVVQQLLYLEQVLNCG